MKNIYLKRITTLCLALVAAWSLNAQTVVYSQDFEGTYPWGMTMIDNFGDGQVWQDNTVWTDGYDQNYTGGTGLCAMTNSDEDINVDWDTDMRLPSIDLTTYTGATIAFKYNFQESAGSQAWVDVSINGGTTWNNVWYRNGDDPIGGLGTPILTSAIVNIGAYAGNNVIIRYRYSDDLNWEWYWQVDDIVVTATTGGGGGANTVDFPTACSLGIAIPDVACPTPTVASTTVSGLAPLTGTTTLLSAEMIITHNWDEDLDVFLESPTGTIVELTTDNGGSGDNFGLNDGLCTQTTRFIMTAPTAVTAGTAPFIGDYLPEGNLADFNNGQDPNGVWKLRACDDDAIITGSIQYFNVTFNIPPVVVPLVYCTPSSSNTCLDFWEYIDNFALGTINNPSNCDGITYTDYTNLSTNLQIGVPSTATTSIGNVWTTDVTDIWIDLNVDGDFDDAGELVSTGNPQVGGISTASVLVPIGTALGSTRLRVGMRDSQADIADPCQTVVFGEFEDYTVNILAAPACLPVTSLSASNITTTSAQLNWTTVPGAVSYDVQYRAVGDPSWIFVGNFPDPTSATIIGSLLPQTQYEFQVMAICASEDAGYSQSQLFSTSCFDCPQGAVTENEVCGADANGGCNMVTPTYEPITAGVPVCGTGWADGSRDTDWYELVVPSTSTITVTLNADFPGAAGILDVSQGCGLLSVIDLQTTDINCSTTTATATVCAGTYIVFAAPSVFSGYPCGSANTYNLVADVVPVGAGQVNEVACGALPLTVGASCNPQSFDNLNTTFCPGGVDPGCASFAGQSVWFYLVVPASGDVTIAAGAGTITDGGMAAYIGPDCNTLTQIACDDDSGPGFLPTIGLNGLTPGDTVWIQYWQYGGGTGTFDLCAFDCNFVPGVGTAELESCLGDSNGGCNAFPEAYETLTCNETVIGTSYFDGGLRDTDWYTYTLTTTTSVSWTVEADFAPVIFILNDDCNNIQLIAQATGNPCDVVTAQAILGPGTYRFFVAPDFSAIFDCTAGDGDYRATLNVSMPDPSIGAPGNACLSDLPITILAAAPGGTFSSNGAGITDPLNGIFDPAAAGVGTWDIYYQIDQNGCSVADTISIVVQDIPGAASIASGNIALCFNPADETYTTTAIPNADSYTWLLTPTGAGTVTGTGTSAVVNFDNAFSGTASLVVAGVNECGTGAFSASLDIVVTPISGTAGTPTGPSSLCQGAPATDYVSAGDPASTSYTWTIVTTPASSTSISGTGLTGTVTWDPAFVGTATITTTGSNNCGTGTASASYTVTINSVSPATITPVSGTLCVSAQPTQLVASPSGGTWSSSPAGVSPSGQFAPGAAGPYAITYTPNGGCSSPASIVINVSDVPAVPSTPIGSIAAQCQNGPNANVFVIPVSGATSYTWSFTPNGSYPGAGSFTDNGNGSGTIDFDPLFYGQTSVIVAATNGCGTSLFSQALLMTINQTPEPIITPSGPYCLSNNYYPLAANVNGGFWSGDGVSGATFNPEAAGLGAADVIYTVIVNGCVGDDTVQVQVQNAPAVSITTPGTICDNQGIVAFSGTPAGGTWSDDVGPGGSFANNVGPGTYTATYTYAGQFGCGGSASIDFDVTGAPVAQFSYSAQCQALTFYDESANGASWSWNFGDGIGTSTAQNTSYIYGTDGNICVTLTVANACGTSDTTICLTVIKCLGVEENGVVDQLNLYPNPTSGMLNVFFNSAKAQNYQINVVDITGKVLYTEMLNNFAGQYNNPLDMTTYASGIYIFRIVGKDGRAANIKVIRD